MGKAVIIKTDKPTKENRVVLGRAVGEAAQRHVYLPFASAFKKTSLENVVPSLKKIRRCRGSNPGHPRDRREYLPLYYNDLVDTGYNS
jgi:hypothetical protein